MKSADKKTAVCFMAARAYPLFNPAVKATFGGAEVDLFWLAVELAKDNDFEVSFMVGDYGQPDVETIHQISLFKSFNVAANLFIQAPKILNALNRARASIYFGECISLQIVLHAFHCFRKKKIYIYRTASSRECDGTYLRHHPLRAVPIKWALKQAKCIVTQNQNDAVHLKETLGLDCRVIQNALPVPELQSKSNDTILWIGRSADVKKPKRFIELASEFPDNHFTMICSKNSGDIIYDDLCHQAKQQPNLTFIPGVPFQQVDSYYRQAAFLVNTSDSEGFPNTFVQACFYGVPILSLNVNPDNFLTDQHCGLCAAGDWNLFFKMAGRLLDSQVAAPFGQNARQYAIKNHDITKIIQQYKALFKSL